MNRYNDTSKVAGPPLVSTRLLDQVRERIRYLHYSLKTEKAYLYWARFYVLWSARQGGMRHPKELGSAEVQAFLTMLANERQVSPATHRQALNALLFLYRQVLSLDLPWMQQIGRPPERKRIPVVLTVAEVLLVFAHLRGVESILARLLYGTGLRLAEGLSIRVKDLDFDRHVLIVRSGKGDKDRVVMLPRSLVPALRQQLADARALWSTDRAAGRPGVFLPHALDQKYPRAGQSWALHWVFPAEKLSVDPRTGSERRHHIYEKRLSRQLKQACASAGVAKHVTVHTLPLLRHPPAAIWHRHPHRAGAARPFRRQHHHDLHPCAQAGGWRHGEPAGCIGGTGSGLTTMPVRCALLHPPACYRCP